jgi:hypothetical protein
MAINTFATLKTAIADFLNREDLTAVIPTFVALAEAQHRREIRDYRMITRAALTINTQFEAVPTDWVQTIRITIDASPTKVLEQVSMNDITEYRESNSDTAGVPMYFAHVGSEIEIWPTPGDTYTGAISYYAKPTALSADGDSNWLLLAAPDIYLYGALMHSAPYLKDDARTAVWAGLYAQAVQSLEAESNAARFGSTLRMRIK